MVVQYSICLSVSYSDTVTDSKTLSADLSHIVYFTASSALAYSKVRLTALMEYLFRLYVCKNAEA